MSPIKPEVTVVDGYLALVIDDVYLLLTASRTNALIRKLQPAHAQLLKEQKRAKRKGA